MSSLLFQSHVSSSRLKCQWVLNPLGLTYMHRVLTAHDHQWRRSDSSTSSAASSGNTWNLNSDLKYMWFECFDGNKGVTSFKTKPKDCVSKWGQEAVKDDLLIPLLPQLKPELMLTKGQCYSTFTLNWRFMINLFF